MTPNPLCAAAQAAYCATITAAACLLVDNIIAAVNRAMRTTPPPRWPDRGAT